MPNSRLQGVMKRAVFGFASVSLSAMAANAQEAPRVPSFNLHGSPGLIDMPTAETAPDATLSTTFSYVGDTMRSTIGFQITPRLAGYFRYTALANFVDNDDWDDVYFDRSFDVSYQILRESKYRPALTLGMRDVLGTGLYSAEYLVATKTLSPGLKVTGGIGWGRLGSYNSFASAGTRSDITLELGGIPTYDRWFRGDISAFGGVSYAPNDRWNFKLEYSSDAYNNEVGAGQIERTSPWNFGIDYRFKNGNQLSLYHVHGTEVGAQFTLSTNPKFQGIPGGVEPAGVAIKPRNSNEIADLGWTLDANASSNAKNALGVLAAKEGLVVEAVKLENHRATVRLVNPRYGAPSQAIGRLARTMSRSMPASIEEFVIVPIANGVPMSAVILKRSDLERLEHESADKMLAEASIIDGYNLGLKPNEGLYPKFEWRLAPYVDMSVFNPSQPVKLDVGVRASAEYYIRPNIVLEGSITKKLAGNLDKEGRSDESALPRVRTDNDIYSREGDPAIEYLQVAAYGRPGRNLYSRLSVGYLERMYGGVSAELLWKPVNSRFALGAELNYIQRRDYDQLFGFQDMTTVDPETGAKYDIPHVNGHVSAYYDLGNGFHGQLDVGRYLAGDYGGTISIDREFANGWKVGAYATFTDVSAEDFGEGSFDKGLRFYIPLAPFIGQPSRKVNPVTIQSLSRDGGARLNVRGRLYEETREYHEPEIAKSWGRFWR